MSKGLGRGLNAIFGEETNNIVKKDIEEKELEKIVKIKVTDIEPMLNQPRKVFDKSKLQELADSIKEHGILQPLLVVKDENGYTIIAGERRWRAAKLAKLKEIPVIVKDYTDTKKKQVALIENIQREDLNIVEVAKAIKELMDIDGYSYKEVAKITGKNSSTITNIVRLLKLQNEILEALMSGQIVEGHARALLALDSKKRRLEILEKTIDKKLTVRDVERLVYGSEEYVKKNKGKVPKNIFYENVQNKLKNYFGYKVKISGSKSKQKLVIEYNNEEGLESIINKLKIKL